ncbi:MAG: PEP-CTERM sorting domain-containing protein, partial [Acidobacteriota bacterium]|nr:PEP-CTERM sorting domain-containing protein [Acidobacteriota bacterium]
SKKLRIILPALALAMGVAHAGPIATCGRGVSPPGGVAPNPGGASVVTNSTTTSVTCIDTPVTARVDQYATTLSAVLNGSQTVFQQAFALPFSDPAVQAAVVQADAILTANKATFKSPALISSSTTPQSSVLSFVQTSSPYDPALCVAPMTSGTTIACPGVVFTVDTTSTFGPATILTGDNQSQTFTIIAGQLDINVNVDRAFTVTRNAVTTNTFLTTQSFQIDGTSAGPIPSVPEPGSWALLLTGAAGMILLGWKKQRSDP